MIRYGLMALVGLGFAAYCAYDGFYAYPKKLKYCEAFAEITGEDDDERSKKWKAITEEKGWPYDPDHFPIEPKKCRRRSTSNT